MSSYPITKRLRVSSVVVLLAAGVGALMNGCDGGREGERCNPNLSHSECNDGLTCVQPSTCVENYCCPANPSTSTNPYCNGALCPSVDGGGSDAGTGDAGNADGDGDGGTG